MEKALFVNAVKDLCEFFERKAPAPRTIELWHESVRNLPGEPVSWILEQIKDHEAYPRNLPKTLWALYHEWLRKHPDKKAMEQQGCDYCQDVFGMLFLRKYFEPSQYWYNETVRCPRCNKGREISELISEGFTQPLWIASMRPYHAAFPPPVRNPKWEPPACIRPENETEVMRISADDLPF